MCAIDAACRSPRARSRTYITMFEVRERNTAYDTYLWVNVVNHHREHHGPCIHWPRDHGEVDGGAPPRCRSSIDRPFAHALRGRRAGITRRAMGGFAQ